MMPKHTTGLALLWTLIAISLLACRTFSGDKGIEIPEPLQKPGLADPKDPPILQKVIGDLTRDYPENRVEVCTLIASDVADLPKVKTEIANVKIQALADGFILTGVIPSIQYFGYVEGEKILLSEISDIKRRIRMPESEQGNPSLDFLMEILNQKCGVKDARP